MRAVEREGIPAWLTVDSRGEKIVIELGYHNGIPQELHLDRNTAALLAVGLNEILEDEWDTQ